MQIGKRARTALFAAAGALVVVAGAVAQGKKMLATKVLAVGTHAPDFKLADQNSLPHTLAENRGKVVLLAFYPADFTGGCTVEAHALTAAQKDLQALGVVTYGVSVQDAKSHSAFCSKEGINYTLLADTDKAAAKSYGVYLPVMGGIASRVTYIIGKDGKVAYVDKDVNAHINSCGADWAKWLKAHPAVTGDAPTAPAAAQSATLGRPAPDFSLPDALTGQATSLADLREGKKAAVVIFIATRCPVSNAYNDRMVAMAKQYSAKGVAFAGINSNSIEPTAEVADHARQHHFPFPVLKDEGNKIADVYDAHVTPEVYVADAQGTLVYHGRIDNSQDPAGVKTRSLATALDEVLAGKPVARAETKAFGCSIKRAEAQ